MKLLALFLVFATLNVFTPYRALAVTNDAIACWDLNESSGAAADSGPSSYTLTNTNTVAYSAGKLNNAADFGSVNTNKRLNTSSHVGLLHNTNYTFNFWVNVTTAPSSGTENIMMSWADTTTVNGKIFYQVKLYNNAGTPQVYITRSNVTTTNQVGVNQTLTPGTWYMLTNTWDGSTHKLYLNGNSTPILSQASTITGSNTVNATDVDGYKIGTGADNANFFRGLIDVMMIYNRALSTAEISALYNSGTGLDCAGAGIGGGAVTPSFKPWQTWDF